MGVLNVAQRILIMYGRHQQAFWTELTLPADFASKEAVELDGVEVYRQLKKVRDSYAYPPAVRHQRDDGEASEALRKARFVLVGKDGHKPQLAEAYKDPTSSNQSVNSYLLEGGNITED